MKNKEYSSIRQLPFAPIDASLGTQVYGFDRLYLHPADWISIPRQFYRWAYLQVDGSGYIHHKNCWVNCLWTDFDRFFDRFDFDFLICWNFVHVLVVIVEYSLYLSSDKLVCHWWLLCSVLVCLDHPNTNSQHRPYIERLHKYHLNGISAQTFYEMMIDVLSHMYEFPDTLCSNNMLNVIGKRFKLSLIWVRSECNHDKRK